MSDASPKRIALDAMGGDFAPREIIKGAKEASVLPIKITLVGDQHKIRQEIARIGNVPPMDIVHASEIIEMNEAPTAAVKQKKDASINVAIRLLKEKKVDAVVSAGNTGAFMTSALLGLGRIKGIERPAIATVFPTMDGNNVLLLDMGANVDCKAKNMAQFALMGSLYAEKVMHKSNPRVGLLNIGAEEEKGNSLTFESYPLLEKLPINFKGNVEGQDILKGTVDVIVCDGFVGNIVLKFAESASRSIFGLLKEELSKNIITKLGTLLLMPAFRSFRKKVDYDENGGAPLLGLGGLCIKAHGSANSRALYSAIKVAYEGAESNIIDIISKVDALKDLG